MYAHPLLISPTASRPVPALLRTRAPAEADMRPQKILVPVDGSRTSDGLLSTPSRFEEQRVLLAPRERDN
jgi:hypothetical protein